MWRSPARGGARAGALNWEQSSSEAGRVPVRSTGSRVPAYTFLLTRRVWPRKRHCGSLKGGPKFRNEDRNFRATKADLGPQGGSRRTPMHKGGGRNHLIPWESKSVRK